MPHDAVDNLLVAWGRAPRPDTQERRVVAQAMGSAWMEDGWQVVPTNAPTTRMLILTGIPVFKLYTVVRTYPGDEGECRLFPRNTPYLVLDHVTDIDVSYNAEVLHREFILQLCQPDPTTPPHAIPGMMFAKYLRFFGLRGARRPSLSDPYLNLVEALENLTQPILDLVGRSPPIVTALPWHMICGLGPLKWLVEQRVGPIQFPSAALQDEFDLSKFSKEDINMVAGLVAIHAQQSFAAQPEDVRGMPINTIDTQDEGYSTGNFGRITVNTMAYAPLSDLLLDYVHPRRQAGVELALLVANYNHVTDPELRNGLVCYTDAHLAITPAFDLACHNEIITEAVVDRMRVGIIDVETKGDPDIFAYYVLGNIALSAYTLTQNYTYQQQQALIPFFTDALDLIKLYAGQPEGDMYRWLVVMCSEMMDYLFTADEPDEELNEFLRENRNAFKRLSRLMIDIHQIPGLWLECFDNREIQRLEDAKYEQVMWKLLEWGFVQFANGLSEDNGWITLFGSTSVMRRMYR